MIRQWAQAFSSHKITVASHLQWWSVTNQLSAKKAQKAEIWHTLCLSGCVSASWRWSICLSFRMKWRIGASVSTHTSDCKTADFRPVECSAEPLFLCDSFHYSAIWPLRRVWVFLCVGSGRCILHPLCFPLLSPPLMTYEGKLLCRSHDAWPMRTTGWPPHRCPFLEGLLRGQLWPPHLMCADVDPTAGVLHPELRQQREVQVSRGYQGRRHLECISLAWELELSCW